MTINNIKAIYKHVVMADLCDRSADFVVSIFPNKYIQAKKKVCKV